MGKEKYRKEIEHLLSKSPVVSFLSIARIVKSKKKNVKQYDKQLIRNLLLKGVIKRLSKGCYTIHDDHSLAVYCFKPSYLGLQDAMSFHNVWEQETVPVIITAKKVRSGIRKILGMNVLIKRIDNKYLFGFDYHQQGSFYFPYSDIEKTFIDMVYFRQHIDKDIIKIFNDRMNRKKLFEYLKAYPQNIKKRISSIFPLTRAIFIGRFQPFHNAHLLDIKKILKEVDEIIIAIGSSQERNTLENPFSYAERSQMIVNVLKKNKIKNYKVYPVPDLYNDEKWIQYIKNNLPEFNIVNSGNRWTLKCFKKFDSKVKKIKLVEGISSTTIRNMIIKNKNWQKLVPKEVEDYIKKINGVERVKSIYVTK